ncbi:hypothetical protein BDE02_06G066600 [Populus trichocarpa]|nr:hypothetical protein BDE02_06G066600 [Populus trichocarpa]KAI5584236.1 hypothetical protein BDE02_06G066600 [Populus trichocarpa]
MAASIKLLFLLLISLSFTYITSEPEPEPEPQRFSLENILDQLKSHISVLESRIDDRTREIRSKDEKIRQMEMIIHEKSKSIDSLMSEIESLQPKGVIDVKEQSSKSYARIGELEKQVDKLRKELESQSQEKDSVEIRAYVAEKKYKELSLKLETVQVHGEWFPHWLTVYFSNFQYHVVTHWDEHGRQALDMTVQKVLEKKSQFDKWAEHHTETIYNKWIPMFKDWLLNCISYLWECIPPQTTKCDELFHAWKKTALHHAINRVQLLTFLINFLKANSICRISFVVVPFTSMYLSPTQENIATKNQERWRFWLIYMFYFQFILKC